MTESEWIEQRATPKVLEPAPVDAGACYPLANSQPRGLPRHCHAGDRGPGVGPKPLRPIAPLPLRKLREILMGMGPRSKVRHQDAR